jgi:chromodomain-helicase-DNA-binding protein 1
MKSGTDELEREQKLTALKQCLHAIGQRIETVAQEKKEQGLNEQKCRKHLWM